MPTAATNTALRYPTEQEIHAQLLSYVRYCYKVYLGVDANVGRDSEHWYRQLANAKRVCLAIANGQIGLRDVNPLEATGDALTDWASVFGVPRRAASVSRGFVVAVVRSPGTSVSLPTDFQGTSASGKKYRVLSTTTVANGGVVELYSVDTGASAELAAGAILTWDSAGLAYLGQTATVAAGGIDGGHDADDDETLRARLLRRLSFPGVGGNWSQVATWAEDASAAIAFAAVYPTVRGGNSQDVAVMGEFPDHVLNSAITGQAMAAVSGQMPGFSSLLVTSVAQEELDVLLNLEVPLPRLSGGIGGGWIDAEPWPTNAENAANVYAEITSIDTGAHTITVNSTTPDAPVAGKHIAVWDYASLDANGDADPQFRRFVIQTVTGSTGAYVLTLDSADMSFLEVGMFCSADAEHLQTYGELFFAAMGNMGPGEKTADADILVYARRKPGPDVERPYALTTRQLTEVERQRAEISNLSFAARLETGTNTTRTTPSVPSTTAGSPRILKLQHLGIRRAVS